jgi:hypothetical protein
VGGSATLRKSGANFRAVYAAFSRKFLCASNLVPLGSERSDPTAALDPGQGFQTVISTVKFVAHCCPPVNKCWSFAYAPQMPCAARSILCLPRSALADRAIQIVWP